MYVLEEALVNDLLSSLTLRLTSPWGVVKTATEFFYARGRTDVVAMTDDGEIIAFEAKITKWRDAMHQAYRNTCFAHRSYIVVPEETATHASRHTAEFEKRSVGICYLSEGRVVIALEAGRTSPLQPWLSVQAATLLTTGDVNEHIG